MKNMKIEINDEQPLDEVVAELERLRCSEINKVRSWENIIYIFSDGLFFGVSFDLEDDDSHHLTTLAELKEMK